MRSGFGDRPGDTHKLIPYFHSHFPDFTSLHTCIPYTRENQLSAARKIDVFWGLVCKLLSAQKCVNS